MARITVSAASVGNKAGRRERRLELRSTWHSLLERFRVCDVMARTV
jgi:hypothetical protein